MVRYIGKLTIENAYRIYMIAEYWEGSEVYEIDPVYPFSYYPWGGTS